MEKPKQNPRNKPESSTQRHLDIDSIQDSVVILKDGGLRAVLMASSINFDLKANEEQDSIIYAYQNFLNALDFPVQIQISSRVLNINGYIKYLREFEQIQTNDLLRNQTGEYISFIQQLVTGANIVNKTFYVVIPFDPVERPQGLLDKLSGAFNKTPSDIKYSKEEFEKYKTQLWQRVNNIMYGLKRSGIYMIPLNTQELIELYYSLYNPDTKPTESLHEISDLDIT